MRRHMLVLALAAPLAAVVGWGVTRPGAADEPRGPEQSARADVAPKDAGGAAWTTAVEPKPLSENVRKGLAWLAEHQGKDGGWGQGEESAQMRGSSNDELRDRPNVADTCIAALALIRAGSTPTSGPYRDAIARAVKFVARSVEASDAQSIAVTTVQGTRVQQKLGPYIDTFLASLLLAEVKGRMGDPSEERLATAALDKVLDKINRHQKADGSFDNQGWAPILAQSLCGKGINRARQAGANVPAMALARSENGAKAAASVMMAAPATPSGVAVAAAPAAGPVAGRGGSLPFRAMGSLGGGGDAGVELYSRSANISQLQDAVNTAKVEEKALREELASAKSDADRDRVRKRLDEIAETEQIHQKAQAEAVGRLSDPRFIAGFGSNGGEEFISYMNLAESLVVKGGDEWKSWDEKMTANLNRIQNPDGSWTGHHCITGRTFCTSSALLVLLADRTPIPAQARDKDKESPKSDTTR